MVPVSQFPTWPMNICILKWKPVNKTGKGGGEGDSNCKFSDFNRKHTLNKQIYFSFLSSLS